MHVMMHAIAKKEAVVLAREHALYALNASLVLRNITLELPPCLSDDGASAAPGEKEEEKGEQQRLQQEEKKEEVQQEKEEQHGVQQQSEQQEEEKQEGKPAIFATRFSWRLVWIVCLSLYVVFLIVFYFFRMFR